MAKATPLICNFNAGEVSPLIDARSDLAKYFNGCRTLQNFIPHVEGGVTRMPGTYFVKEVKDSDRKTRLFPFHFSTVQAYQLEFGERCIRFYMNHGQVVIDTSMDDFYPSSSFFVGEYTKLGDYKSINAGGGSKYLYVAAPYGQVGSDGIKVACATNGTTDTLEVTAATDTITIKLAYTTSSKNTAYAIQTALRALGTVNSIDVSNWTVTENAAYAAARPTAGISIAAGLLTAHEKIYQAIIKQTPTTYVGGERTLDFRGVGGVATSISIASNTSDTLSVTCPATVLIIKLANSTPSKNSANLIEAAINALGTVGPCTVTENSWYSLNRPTDGVSIPSTTINPGVEYWDGEMYGTSPSWLILKIRASLTNAAKFPVAETTYWKEDTLGNPVEVVIPYNENDIFDIKRKPQSGDVLYLFHPSHPPAKLARHSHINWEYVALDLKSGDGGKQFLSAVTNASPPSCTTSSNHGFQTGDKVHLSGILGMIELNDKTFTITVTGNNTFTLDGIDSTYYTIYSSGGIAQRSKSIMASEGEYPSCGVFFEQRLCLAGYANYPQRVDMSATSDYENFFQSPTEDDAAVQFTIVSDKMDRIRWLASEEYLLVGTADGIWKVGGGSLGEPITATSIQAKKQIGLGVCDIDQESAINAILWASRGKTSLRQVMWSLEADKYVAPNLTRLASHIFQGATEALSGIKEMMFQREPIPIMWCIRNDGQLLGMTYEVQEQVYAWFRVVTDGLFESVSVISKDGAEDEIWVIVNRTIGGVTKRYVEYFTSQEFYGDIEDCFYLHSGLTWDGGETMNISAITKANPPVVTVSAWPANGVELVNFLAAGWNVDGTKWKFLDKNLVHTNSDTTPVTAVLGATIVAGHCYKVVLKGTGGGGTCLYTLGGTSGTAISDSSPFTVTDWIVATNSGSLIITPQAVSTTIFTSISVQEFDYILTAGDKVNISGVVGMTQVNIGSAVAFTVGTVDIENRTFQLAGIDGTGYTTYVSGGVAKKIKNVFTTGFPHIAGKTVDALVDGVADRDIVVGGTGTVQLTIYGHRIHIGLPYTSKVEPMKLNAGSTLGTGRSKKQRINAVSVTLLQTCKGQIGPDDANLLPIDVDAVEGVLVDQEYDVEFGGDWGRDAKVCVVQDDPYPMTVISLVPRLSLNED